MTRIGLLAAWHLPIKSQGSAFEVRNETSKNFHMLWQEIKEIPYMPGYFHTNQTGP